MHSSSPRHNDDFIASQLLPCAKDAANWLNRSASPPHRKRDFIGFHAVATADLNYRSAAFQQKSTHSTTSIDSRRSTDDSLTRASLKS